MKWFTGKWRMRDDIKTVKLQMPASTLARMEAVTHHLQKKHPTIPTASVIDLALKEWLERNEAEIVAGKFQIQKTGG